MSMCNYCSFKRLQESAKAKGKRLVKIPSTKMGTLGGCEVYMLNRGEKPSKKNCVSWMMKIPESCEC